MTRYDLGLANSGLLTAPAWGDQRERWVGSSLLAAEKQFRHVKGCKQIPALVRVLETLKPPRKVVVTRRKAP